MIKLYTVISKIFTGTGLALSIVLFSFLLVSTPQYTQAQITENFEAPPPATTNTTIIPNLPHGWTTRKLSGNTANANDFISTSLSTGTPNNPVNPVPTTPPSTPQFLMYRGYAATATEDAILVSPAYDFRNGSGTFSFQFFHSTSGASGDYIEVYTNSVPVFGGATLIAGSTIQRNNGSTGWALKSFTIPQVANCKTYIIIRAVSGATNSGNMYFDSFSITTAPQAMTYTGFGAVQNANPVGLGQTNQDILKLMIITCGAGTPINLTSLNFNTNGTTNLSYISSPKVWYTKGNNNFTPGSTANIQFGTSPAVGTNLTFTGSQALENDTNYFWLTYDISSLAAAAGNYVDADWLDFTLSGSTGLVATNLAPVGARLIAQNYCIPAYGCGTCWPGDFIQDVQTYNGVNGVNIVNNNSGANPSPPYYTFYPATTSPPRTMIIQQSQTYQFRSKVGTYPSGNNIVAWIDYDGNGYFSAEERIYEAYWANGGAYLAGNGQATGSFTVPTLGSGTNPSYWGPRRMRVREIWINHSSTAPTTPSNSYSPSTTTPATGHIHPCNYYSYGETEDYIVTIVPNCFSGEWLGFTTDWDDPANWCDGVPTPTTNVTIPTVPKGGKMPTIFNGTLATCNNILIQPSATVTIESPKSGNWQIYGTLTNNGTIEVKSVFNNNFVIGSGTLESTTTQYITPFLGATTDGRTQMRYLASELLAKGFTAGDAISTVGFQVRTYTFAGVNAANTFKNFTLTIGHASANPWTYNAATTTAPNSPWTSFSGTTTSYTNAAYLPTANSNNLFNLSTPFIWNGTDDIMVETCYDNPQSSSERTNHYQVYYTQTTGVPTMKGVGMFNNATYQNGCAFPPNIPTTSGVFGQVLDRRANLIVESFSPNGIYPIYVRGDWVNNGSFIAGRSNVIFDGTAIQLVSGTNLTTFSRMSVSKSSGVVRLNRSTDIDSSLYLGTGVLELNNYTLTLKNPTVNSTSTVTTLSNFHGLTTVPAWARNTGFIRAETSATLGYVQWNIGNVSTVPTTYRFPFGSGAAGTTTGNDVPIDIDYTTANTNLGNVKASTYGTPPNNLAMPPTVTHINGLVASPNDPYMIDRYWIIERSGSATSGAGFKVNWVSSENAVMNPVPYRVQRWDGSNWPNPGIGSHSGTQVSVTSADLGSYAVPGWQTVNIWAAAGLNTPLPIELLSFDAQLKGKEVHLRWVTASEKDNDYFTIEKTRDANEYIFVEKVPSLVGTSNNTTYYNTIDRDPLRGVSYYRLAQTDYDGTTTYSKLVPVNYSSGEFDIIYTSNNENEILIAFGYDSEEPLSYHVTDALGRVIIQKEKIQVLSGMNLISLDATSLVQGVYFITMYNSDKTVSRKIFYTKQ